MTEEMMDKAFTQVSENIEILIDENRAKLRTAMRDQMVQQAEDEADLVFGLTMGATIEPCGNRADVKCKLAWGAKTTKKAESVVDDHPDLFKGDGGGE